MSLLKTTAKGVVWTSVSSVVRSVVSVLQIAILTRYLEKADFGLVAIATLFLGFTQIFLDLGISAGILHKQDTTPEQYSSLFWLNIFSGIILTLLLCVLAPLVAVVYNEPELTPILCLLGLSILFSSLGAQHRTVQQKKLRFKYISMVEVLTSLLSMGVAAWMAITGYGVYSIIYAGLFGSATSGLAFLLIGLAKDRNISFHFSIKDTYPFLKIGVYSIGSNVLDYFSRELDIIIISATLGKEAVGVYSLCKKLVTSIYNAVTPILMKVLTPVLATLQHEEHRLKVVFLDVVQSMAIFNYPLYYLIAIFSYGILNFLYGSQYVDGVYVLMFISITYGMNSTMCGVGALQIATGRTDAGFYWTVFRILFTIIAVYIGSLFNISILALSLMLLGYITNPIFWRITIKPLVGGTYWEFFRCSLYPTLYMYLYSLPFFWMFGQKTSVVFCLFIGLLYLIIYTTVCIHLYRQSYLVKTMKERILPNFSKRIK